MMDKSVSEHRRSYALDALRGYAILTMVLSGVLSAGLPAWMHHAQVPPPDFKFNPNLPGLTWVDLVFPFFLFSMGAAFPMALSSRIDRGVPYWKIVLGIFSRWFLLIGFALYTEHSNPEVFGYSSAVNNLLGIVAFALVFAALVRVPDSWALWQRWGLKTAGIAGAAAFVVLVRRADGGSFAWNRTDIIIQILANVAVFGSLVWLVSRRSILARLAILGVLMAFRLASPSAGWVNWFYGTMQQIPYLSMSMVQYLFIVVPATVVGDMVLAWMKSKEEATDQPGWSPVRLGSIVALMLAFTIVMLIGLQMRLLWQTTLAGLAMCVVGWLLLRRPSNSTETLLSNLYPWGAWCLIIGLAFEPYEGGIKKDPATMSYYFVTAGLAVFLLIAFTITIDIFGKRRWLQLLIDNGQNPMIAYIGRGTLVLPLLALTHINPLMDRLFTGPWPGFAHSLITTLAVAVVVSLFTRARIFWRT